MRKEPSLYQEENIFITRLGVMAELDLYKLPNNLYLPLISFNFQSLSHNLLPLDQAPPFIVFCVKRHISFGDRWLFQVFIFHLKTPINVKKKKLNKYVCFSSVNLSFLSLSLQSCPTLCHPIDGSLPGSPIPGILQARILEWVAVSFSNA